MYRFVFIKIGISVYIFMAVRYFVGALHGVAPVGIGLSGLMVNRSLFISVICIRCYHAGQITFAAIHHLYCITSVCMLGSIDRGGYRKNLYFPIGLSVSGLKR